MNLYNVSTETTRRSEYLGHWYAETPEKAKELALAYYNDVHMTPLRYRMVATASTAWDKAYNSENKGGMPKPFTSESINARMKEPR